MTTAEIESLPKGEHIECSRCSGHGLLEGYDGPDECPDCGGSGKNWRYPGGAIARYYSGPLIGRDTALLRQASDKGMIDAE